ncbi:MAG: iron-containing alcohol dehydrogenase [Deltaproteobacteria bacterium]|nr:iron-containing alcohol dehydrogenase [Deltaproteobacteria bacterium]
MAISLERKQFPLLYVNPNSRGIVGWGAHQMAGVECHANGIKHALLVTTGLKGTGIVDEVEGVLKANGVSATRFEGISSNPKDHEVKNGANAFLDAECDGIVSVGGGSSHDTGKAIRIMAAHEGPDTDLRRFAAFIEPPMGSEKPTFNPVTTPHVAINTTTGTGAECTNAAVVTDVEWAYKLILAAPGALPSVGISDPAFMRLQPPAMVAQSGMDALCHSMEPAIGRLNFPVSHAVGFRAIKLLSENIRQAYANPANDVAIENMAWAQLLGGMCFNMGGGMGMAHGLGHMISALKDIHHGLANAIMMMPVERFNVIAVPEKFKEIGMAMGLDVHHMNPVQAADRTLEALERLRNDLGIPQIPLREYDFTEEDVEHTAKWAINDISKEANPRDMTLDQIKEIMRSII